MKAIWYLVNKETHEVVGTTVLEGNWADADFRASLLDLCEHYSKDEYLVPDFDYDAL